MLTILLFLLVMAVILIWPVKIAAKYVQAGRTGAFTCLFAIIVVAVVQRGLESYFHSQGIVFLAILLIAPLVYMIILDTSYLKGFVISIVQVLLTFVFVLIFSVFIAGVVAAGN